MNDWIKALIACLTLLAGGIAWAVMHFTPREDHIHLLSVAQTHVPVSNFEKHLEAEESRYVLQLKKEIREIRQAIHHDPNNRWLNESLQDLIDTLCELRPNDKLCR